MKNALVAVTCLSLAACGGGGSGDGPTTVESSVTFIPPQGILEYEVTLATKSTFRCVACDPEGRHILGGRNAGMGFLARYLSTGELDPTFGWVFLSQVVEWRSLAVRADGMIVAMGHKPDGTTVVASYEPNGSLKAMTQIALPSAYFWGAAMAVDTDRIVVAGMAWPTEGGEKDAAIMVLTPQLAPQPDFGSPKALGFWSLSIPGDDAFEAVSMSNGTIFAGGSKAINEVKHALLALLPASALDWEIKVDDAEGAETKITDLAILPDGKILAAVSALEKSAGFKAGVWRFDSAGILDTGFAKTYVKDDPGSAKAKLAVQSDGNFLLTVTDRIVRVLKDGGLDKSFVLGKAEHVFFDILLAPANKILVAGINDGDGAKAWFAQYR